jgi:predicted DNA-binding transcriptional regulator YafY
VNRTDRLYALAEELRSAGSRGRTSDWLANRFEVSVRTIKRDLSALQQAGTPIWAQPGPGGGYVLDPAASLPPLNFTAAEVVALAVALTSGAALPLATDGRNALAKMLHGMPPDERQRAVALAARVWLRGVPTGRPQLLRVLEEAVRRQVIVSIDYVGSSGERTTRAVEPVALARPGDDWYLLGYCRLRRGPRWFRFTRIRSARLTAEPAPRHDPATFAGTPPADAAAVAVPAAAPPLHP